MSKFGRISSKLLDLYKRQLDTSASVFIYSLLCCLLAYAMTAVRVDFCWYCNFCIIPDWSWPVLCVVRRTQVYLHLSVFKIHAAGRCVCTQVLRLILREFSSAGSLTEKVCSGQWLEWLELTKTNLEIDLPVMFSEKMVVIFKSFLLCWMWRLQLQEEQKVHVKEGNNS